MRERLEALINLAKESYADAIIFNEVGNTLTVFIRTHGINRKVKSDARDTLVLDYLKSRDLLKDGILDITTREYI